MSRRKLDTELCDRAPKGWRCYLPYGHNGPCPAYPNFWTSIRLWLFHGIRT